MVWCSLCSFLIIKLQTTLHHVVWCGVVHCYLRCGVIMPFFGRFWYSFCGLVHTPMCIRNCCQKLTMIIYIYIYIYVSNFMKIVTMQPLRIVNPHFGSIFLHNVEFY